MEDILDSSCLALSCSPSHRHQLEGEVESLRLLVHHSASDHRCTCLHTDLESQAVREKDIRIAALEADLARVRSWGSLRPPCAACCRQHAMSPLPSTPAGAEMFGVVHRESNDS